MSQLALDVGRCQPWPRERDAHGECQVCRVPDDRGGCWCAPGCHECGAVPGEPGCRWCWSRLTDLIDGLTARRAKIVAEIDAQYWRFTRCARGKPPAHHLYVERNGLDARLEELRFLASCG